MSDLLLSAAAVLLMTAILTARQPTLPGRVELALSLTGGAAWFLFRADNHTFALLTPLVLIAPLLSNRAFRAAFEAPGRPILIDAALGALLLTTGLLTHFHIGLPIVARTFDILALLLFADLTLTVLKGWPGDLIEARRHLRLGLLGLGAVISLAVALAAVLGAGDLAAHIGAIAALILGFAAAAVGPRLLNPITAPQTSSPAPRDLDDREQQVLRRLRAALASGDLIRDPNLSLSRLARHLDVPEHRLRRVIHLGEKHRHFNAWLSAHRLALIRQWMDDPGRDGDTLLTLATDAGYSSLSAFNRAFKAAEGATPSAMRAARQASRNASTANAPDGSNAA